MNVVVHALVCSVPRTNRTQVKRGDVADLADFAPGSQIRIHFIRIRIFIQFIRIWHFRLNNDPDPFQIQGFDDQKFEEKKQLKIHGPN
jgi:hypothetical protein